MKLTLSLFAAAALSLTAHAEVHKLQGSTTLAGVMADVITKTHKEAEVQYVGGGSGLGEKALAEGTQGIAPMSRAFKDDVKAKLKAQGVEVVDHVLALDGVAVFVNEQNSLEKLDLETVKKIFTCQITKWEDVPGANRNGEIKVYGRDQESGTTDAFTSLVGFAKLGACAKVVEETKDIAYHTRTEQDAIGYAGLSGKEDGNKALSLARTAGGEAVEPDEDTIRSKEYPLSRDLHLYSVEGTRSPNEVESYLLNKMLDPSFIKPILKANEFILKDN